MKRLTPRRPFRNLPSARAHLVVVENLETRTLLATTPVISEFLASNSGGHRAEDGSSPDWIEIHNPTAAPVNLGGWHLTDNVNDKDMWTFPAVTLGPNQYLVVFASGDDRRTPGEELHTNFRLGTDGEYLALVDPLGVAVHEFNRYPPQYTNVSFGMGQDAQQLTLVPRNAPAWAIVPPDGSLGLDWTSPTFNHSTWKSGTTGVGYERNNEPNPVGLDLNQEMLSANSTTAYARVPFQVSDPASLGSLKLRMNYDDGFIAYLNGVEIAAMNDPATPRWDSAATAQREVGAFDEWDVTSYLFALRPGNNVLAIHGLNNLPSSSDFLVHPELVSTRVGQSSGTGYLLNPTPGTANLAAMAQLGPVIRDLSLSPAAPADANPAVVTVRVERTAAAVAGVTLTYRVMFGTETSTPMLDDGAHGDGAAGDGVYGATIPASASGAGELVRYYVTAGDVQGASMRSPLPQGATPSAQYHGYMVASADPAVAASQVPVWHWFVENPGAADQRTGTRASVVYNGVLYDNIFVRRRGGNTTTGNQFEFNKSQPLQLTPDVTVDQLDINGKGSADDAHVRQHLSFETFADAGSVSSTSFMIRVQRNGTFLRLGTAIEHPDAEYFERQGLYGDGPRYKFAGDFPTMTNANDGRIEKKNRLDEDRSGLQAFLDGIHNPDLAARARFLFDNVDIPRFLNYWAANTIVNDNDDAQKNYYLYQDLREARNPKGTNEWMFAPWDKDLTFGKHFGLPAYNAQDPQTHPFFGDSNHPKIDGAHAWNWLIDSLLDVPAIKQMYLRRLRTLMDEMLLPPGTSVPENDRYFESRLNTLLNKISNEVGSLSGPFNDIKSLYLERRRNHLYVNHSQNTSYPDHAGIPGAQAANPAINFGLIEFLPASFNQEQEFIELRNLNAYAVDLSGWKIDGGVTYTIEKGVVAPANGSVYISPDPWSFRQRTSGPRGNLGLLVVGPYRGQLSSRGEALTLTDRSGRQVSTGTYTPNVSPAQQNLKITEVMFEPKAPPSGSPYFPGDFEYVELRNTGATSLNLAGVHFESGITFTFPAGSTLAPGAYTVLVRNQAAFQSRYGNTIPIGGTFTGVLDNAGELLELRDARNEKILAVDYGAGWFDNASNGEGFSIVVRDTNTFWRDYEEKENWRPSKLVNGNPGAADDGMNPNSVVISEVMPSGSAAVGGNWVELKNQTNQDINIGGWFLSDSTTNLKKWTIPAGTVVPANGHRVLDQTGGFGPAFTLSTVAGAVYLSGSDGLGSLAGYRDSVDFDGATPNVSFGRHIKSTGASDFVAMRTPTPAANNAAPVVGPVVITELMYRPTAGNQEFIELRNISGSAMSLAGWAFTDGVSFTFPAGAQIGSSETILVVPIDPAAFRNQYAIPAGVQIFGPYTSVLSGAGEGVTLSRPGTPVAGQTPMIRVDRVSYEDDLPWPAAADGSGPSLGRVINPHYGNDVANWRAESNGGTPGQPNTGAPYAMFAGIEYGPNSPRVVIRFNENVAPSIASSDLTITRLSDNQTISPVSYAYNPATFTATWTLPATLLDGNYRLSISAGSIVDGTSLALDGDLDGQVGGNLWVQSHHLSGDLNQDRTVDHFDFATLYANFNKPAPTFTTGDLNFDGRVTFADFQIMERQFGKTLTAAQAAAVSAPSPAPVPVRPAPTPKPVASKPVSTTARTATAATAGTVFSAKRIQPAKRRPVEVLTGA